MQALVRSIRFLASLALALSACGDPVSAPDDRPSTFAGVVSDPVTQAAAPSPSPAHAHLSSSLASIDGRAFVSAPPGTDPAATGATVTLRRTGDTAAPAVLDGGFDPIGITALAGDTLDIVLTHSAAAATHVRAVVPASRTPRIVRISPAKGRTDVAINASMAVIFSEPVSQTDLSAAIVLTAAGIPVRTTARPLANSDVGVEIVPASPLSPGTAYQLVITDRVTDLSGDRLEAAGTTDFVTATTNSVPAPTGPHLLFAIEPSDGFSGAALPLVRVTAADGAGSPIDIPGGAVTIVVQQPGGLTSGSVTSAASGGIATFSGIAVASPGTYVLLASAAGLAGAASRQFQICDHCWVMKAAMPIPALGEAAAVVGGRIYAIGGTLWSGGYLNTVEAYDPVTDAWTPAAAMPTARGALGAGVIGGIVYAVGGFANGRALATVEAYDPATNSWATKAPMPTARTSLSVAVLDGILYAIGGGDGVGGLTDRVEAYDPVTNQWSIKAPLPARRSVTGSAAVNGRIYTIGGFSFGTSGQITSTTATEVYDPLANAWTAGGDLPNDNSQPTCAVALGGVLYAFPGVIPSRYDVTTGSWVPGAEAPDFCGSASVIDGTIYVRAMQNASFRAFRP